ncbi:MAG TPA: extracellular solute-binding protein [Labilithrix sp.]|jgi:arabinogalactan oligomer/maltooligosaccharide transport system permease protein|nr:extracellular solute-binding protein [Labilithrix sp.]
MRRPTLCLRPIERSRRAAASQLAKYVVLAIAVALLGALPACASREKRPSIVVWHAYRGAEQRAFEQAARRYELERGVQVTMLAVPYDAYAAKLEAAVPRANGPDVFVSPHERLGSYLAGQLVGDPGDAGPDEDRARYDELALEAVTSNGKRWGVPLATKCVALYLNPRLVARDPATLDELLALGPSLGPGVSPLAYEIQSPYFHAAVLHAFGGRLFDGQGFAMVGPEAERAAAFVHDLVERGVLTSETSGDDAKRLFASGKVAAVFGGPWLASDLGEHVAYRVVPLPPIAGAGRMRPYATVDVAFVTPQGAKRPEARAFARALGDHESARVRATLGGQVVATKSYWDEAGDNAPPLLASFRKAAKDAVVMPSSAAMRATWVPAQNAIRKVLRGDLPASAALAEAKARYEDVMRSPPASPSRTPLVLFASLVLLAVAFGAVRTARAPGFSRALRGSLPAYAYVAHAVLAIVLLVVLPLLAGAFLSFFAGSRDDLRYVGTANYVEILTARGGPLLASGSFYYTLLVTVAWTLVNVVLHLAIGLVLGVLLARPYLRLRAVYRVLLILPWAVPSYVTALAWKGMFHRQFGAVNALLALGGVPPVSWFAKFSTAFAANVTTNVWLGFPFMMVVVMGALTSIPKEVLEAAEVDGATRFQSFRLVTLPLLRPTLLPAVVLGAVWTFNMFNVVFLVSGGEPDGRTDILVSEAYRWAFARNAQIGYAAAYAVLIFGLLALMTRALGRLSGSKDGDV